MALAMGMPLLLKPLARRLCEFRFIPDGRACRGAGARQIQRLSSGGRSAAVARPGRHHTCRTSKAQKRTARRTRPPGGRGQVARAIYRRPNPRSPKRVYGKRRTAACQRCDLGRNRFFRAIDQACGHADGGAAGWDVDRDDRPGADLAKSPMLMSPSNVAPVESNTPWEILGARRSSASFRPMVTFCMIVTSSPISTKAPTMIPVAWSRKTDVPICADGWILT